MVDHDDLRLTCPRSSRDHADPSCRGGRRALGSHLQVGVLLDGMHCKRGLRGDVGEVGCRPNARDMPMVDKV